MIRDAFMQFMNTHLHNDFYHLSSKNIAAYMYVHAPNICERKRFKKVLYINQVVL